jgi:poly(3-hydroxybutyrate) depolymerase
LIAALGCGAEVHNPAVADAPPVRAIDAPSADVPAIVDDPCLPMPHAGHVVYTCNGIAFDVEVPAACIGGGCGVILDVHGLTMSAAMEDANTELRARGGAAGFVVIQPNANPAPPRASWSTSDDPNVFDFLTRAIAVYRIDPRRVHMTGFSQGGFMTWRFLCAHADVLASVAPAAAATGCGSTACSFSGSDVPSRALPVLYMHGTHDDDYVPFSCAQPQIDALVSAWALASDGIVASSATYTRTRWTGAGDGELEFLAHDYTSSAQVPLISRTRLDGHCVPGSTDPGGQPGQLFPFKCEQPASFTWGTEIVAFFVAHPRPG